MPVTLTTAPLPGFWIAMADAAGAKTTRETQLSPAPTRVEYPNAALGDIVETADGRVVVQVSTRDPRRRSWIWANFGPEVTSYERQNNWMRQLVSRQRLAQGLSPYVYIYDGTTGLLNYPRTLQTTVSSVSGSVLTIPSMGSGILPALLTHAVVEVLPAVSGGSAYPYERRSVVSATNTSLTLDNPLSGAPGSSNVLLSWSEPAWWKARILDTTRELRTEGGLVRYASSRLSFVIDEAVTY